MGFSELNWRKNDPTKSITHMLDLLNLFPDIDIDSL